MSETETDHPAKPKDRKLGSEWADWDGVTPLEPEIDENLTTFLILAAGIALIFITLFPVGWYLIKPRIEQFNPFVSNLIEWSIIEFTIGFLIMVLVESTALLKFKKSIFPYKWIEKFLLFFLPKTLWLGAKLGISRDRMGNSFIKVHNFMTKSYADRLNPERVLILLPACLEKEIRKQIMSRINRESYKILTAGGGEVARKAIWQYQPTFILALACERELMSGIKDVAEKVPLLVIPNKRPEGPCKNTNVSLVELDEALRFLSFITGKKN
jgi:hypothetical protein